MSRDWYNAIAKKNGGYKSDAVYTKEGLSGEDAFEAMLIELLPKYEHVLDMGCGHGEFTLQMADYAQHLIGGDEAEELLNIANQLLESQGIKNVSFVKAWTKGDMPFEDEQFDLIYTRRGPTSIVKHPNLLKKGGKIIGIHTFDLDQPSFIEKLKNNGFVDIEFKVFDQARMYFEDAKTFAKYISSTHLSPDYTTPDMKEALQELIEKSKVDNRISWPEHRYIWQAKKG